MRAVDTNVVVRYLTADDPRQFALAVAVVEGTDTFVGVTVLLEAEWVLRGIYRFPTGPVVEALRGLAGLPRVTVEDAPLVALALQWTERGLDFADALHLARAQFCEAFLTFDEDMTRRGASLSAIPLQLP